MPLENEKPGYTGDLAAFADFDVTARQLECPACYEVPLPPIYLCTAGHIVCFSCKSKLDKCPLCQASFSGIRNFVLEGVLSTSKFNCNYKHHGCMETILGEDLKEHLQKCIYRNGLQTTKQPQSGSSNAEQKSPIERLGGCCQWISSSTNYPIPQDAVEGGFENGALLYVSRSESVFGTYTYPGQLNDTTRQHVFTNGHKVRTSNDYQVLVAPPDSVQWVTVEGGQIPSNSVIGGQTASGTFYIGRCGHEDALIVGWVLPRNKLVMSTFDGAVVKSAAFEVLVKTELGIALDLSCN